MKRREFITLMGGAATWPLTARAQQPGKVWRVGILMGTADDQEGQSRVKSLETGLQSLGWSKGHNLQIEYRWATGDLDQMRTFAKELVALAPDVIVASNTPVVAILMQQTKTIPIVFVMVSDPVGSGFVESMARPGHNITGFTNFEYSMTGKWLEMLKELAPRTARVGLMFNPETNPGNGSFYTLPVKTAASAFAVTPILLPVHSAGEIEQAIAKFASQSDGGLIVIPDAFTTSNGAAIIAAATHYSVPSVFSFGTWPHRGGLMSYGIDTADLYRRSASYVDRILKGAKPADLPVQAPVKFEMVINLKTARALGLDVSSQLQQRADEVIE